MKDRLEKFIIENRAEFDAREPDPSLWLKITPSPAKPVKTRRLVWLRYAAAVAVIFASFSAGIYYLTGGPSSQEKLYGEAYQQIVETEVYYSGMIDKKYNELQPYMADSPEIKSELDYDLEELDEIYLELKEDLKDNVGNTEVIDAMIQNYRMKVEILEDLLHQLKEKESNETKDEKKTSL